MKIPRDCFTVITGVSGSGKSTLAFDILFNEGQRRYLESLNAYARQFVQPAARPEVDAIYGIPPTVAIEQRTSRGGRKSTVATLTEIYHFLRLLLREAGHSVLPGLRRRHRTAERSLDRRTPAEGLSRQAHLAARSAGRRAQGLLHGSRQVGREERLQDVARRRRRYADEQVAAPLAVQGAHDRAAGRVDSGGCAGRHAHPRGAHARARLRQGHRACAAEAERRQGDGVLHQARLPLMRAQLLGARSAPLLIQLEARLVRKLFRHGRRDDRLRRGADRRGSVVERVVRARAHRLHGLRRAPAQSGGDQRALPRPEHRLADERHDRGRGRVLLEAEAQYA